MQRSLSSMVPAIASGAAAIVLVPPRSLVGLLRRSWGLVFICHRHFGNRRAVTTRRLRTVGGSPTAGARPAAFVRPAPLVAPVSSASGPRSRGRGGSEGRLCNRGSLIREPPAINALTPNRPSRDNRGSALTGRHLPAAREHSHLCALSRVRVHLLSA